MVRYPVLIWVSIEVLVSSSNNDWSKCLLVKDFTYIYKLNSYKRKGQEFLWVLHWSFVRSLSVDA